MAGDNVKVPASAGNYSAATIDTDLRTSINMALLRDGHVTKIQEHLLQSLNSNTSDWPTMVQNRALALLRSGEVTSFPALMRRMLDDVRAANSPITLAAVADGSSSLPNGSSSGAGGAIDDSSDTAVKKEDPDEGDAKNNGVANGKANGNGVANGTKGADASLTLPKTVVHDALRVTRECLEEVVSVEEEA
ncbi:hypothetical protein TD95_001692 [Thielaviopsis punctulata]|uniref:Uncharacterized protein n=1 Tax=Thielaviopsis punctulata TaxID=72032 RepID=A0A0F4Z9G9_9PEZI|nr:hypothetical protein TD95_001692 [Thielaviopsis punctulata]